MLEGSSLRERMGAIICQARRLADKLYAQQGWTRMRGNGWRHVDDVLDRMRAEAERRIAIYGAGEHTRWLLTEFDLRGFQIDAIVDDDAGLWGRRVLGIEVMSPRAAAERGIEAVLISSDEWDAVLAERARTMILQARVYRLYGSSAALRTPAVRFRAEEHGITE